jgi:hypothetical protein
MEKALACTCDSCEADSALTKLTACHVETESCRKLAPGSRNCLVSQSPPPPCLRRQLSQAGSFFRLRHLQ